MMRISSLLVTAAATALVSCASQSYPSVHWTGVLPSYPAAACVRAALASLDGVQRVDWKHQESNGFSGGPLPIQEDSYAVSLKPVYFEISVAQPTPTRIVFSLTYWKEEDEARSGVVRAAIAAIAKSCAMPDLEQNLRHEYRLEHHTAPDWSKWP
jgi:hypothetical protein